MSTPSTPYLKHDLTILGVLVAVMALAVAALWYFEASQGLFSALAERYLSPLGAS